MDDDEGFLVQLNCVWQHGTNLVCIYIGVKEESIATMMLPGVPEKFQHLIDANDMLTTDRQLSMDFVEGCILEE